MYEEEVARGARWLDKQAPGWELRIDFSTLEMAKCSSCIIGQVWGLDQVQYYVAYDRFTSILELGGLGRQGSKFGFNLADDAHDDRSMCESWTHCEHWDGLAQAWVVEVKRRLDEGVSI